jgi:anti-anti-sigma regulatory factor
MAGNFAIEVRQERDHICLRLCGDFDGNSACELLNTIMDNSGHSSKILIDTTAMKRIHPFGRKVFQRRLKSLRTQKVEVTFAGNLTTEP